MTSETNDDSGDELEGRLAPGPFPIQALNPVLQEVAEESAKVFQTAIQMPALTVIAVLAGALGKTWKITGAVSGAETFGNIFALCAAPRGYGKGLTSGLVEPIKRASDELRKKFYTDEVPKLKSMKLLLGKLIDNHQKKIGLNFSEEINSDAILTEWVRKLDETERRLKQEPGYCIGDTTMAAFQNELARKGECLFSFSPEAGDLVKTALGKYNKDKSADLDLLLSGYSVEPHHTTRLSRETCDLRPCITLLWFCQPLILEGLLFNDEALERGMGARSLGFVMEPEAIPEEDGELRQIASETLSRWRSLILQVLSYRSQQLERSIRCSPEAKAVFDAFHNDSVRLRNKELRDVQGELSRWRENAIRIAVGQHVADYVSGGCVDQHQNVLSKDQAERAVQIAKWFALSMLRITRRGQQTRKVQHLERILKIVKKWGGEITLRNLDNHHGVRKEEAESVAAEFPTQLEIVLHKTGTIGRPSPVLRFCGKQAGLRETITEKKERIRLLKEESQVWRNSKYTAPGTLLEKLTPEAVSKIKELNARITKIEQEIKVGTAA